MCSYGGETTKQKSGAETTPRSYKIAYLKDAIRDRGSRMFPYIASITVASAVVGVGLGSWNRFGSQEDALASMLTMAVGISTRVFKNAKRDMMHKGSPEWLQSGRVSLADQERVARLGSFEQKSALLDNHRIKSSVLTMISADSQFRKELIRNKEVAANDAVAFEQILHDNPGNPYYLGIIQEIRKSASLFDRNLQALDMADSQTRMAQGGALAESAGDALSFHKPIEGPSTIVA